MPENEDNIIVWFRALYQVLASSNGKRSFCGCLEVASEAVSDPPFRRTVECVTEVVRLGTSLSRRLYRLYFGTALLPTIPP